MKINTIPGQTVMDIALQYYGTIEALFIIMEDNPHILNEYDEAFIPEPFSDFDLSQPIIPTVLNIRDEDPLINKRIIKEFINNPVISK